MKNKVETPAKQYSAVRACDIAQTLFSLGNKKGDIAAMTIKATNACLLDPNAVLHPADENTNLFSKEKKINPRFVSQSEYSQIKRLFDVCRNSGETQKECEEDIDFYYTSIKRTTIPDQH